MVIILERLKWQYMVYVSLLLCLVESIKVYDTKIKKIRKKWKEKNEKKKMKRKKEKKPDFFGCVEQVLSRMKTILLSSRANNSVGTPATMWNSAECGFLILCSHTSVPRFNLKSLAYIDHSAVCLLFVPPLELQSIQYLIPDFHWGNFA